MPNEPLDSFSQAMADTTSQHPGSVLLAVRLREVEGSRRNMEHTMSENLGQVTKADMYMIVLGLRTALTAFEQNIADALNISPDALSAKVAEYEKASKFRGHFDTGLGRDEA